MCTILPEFLILRQVLLPFEGAALYNALRRAGEALGVALEIAVSVSWRYLLQRGLWLLHRGLGCNSPIILRLILEPLIFGDSKIFSMRRVACQAHGFRVSEVAFYVSAFNSKEISGRQLLTKKDPPQKKKKEISLLPKRTPPKKTKKTEISGFWPSIFLSPP